MGRMMLIFALLACGSNGTAMAEGACNTDISGSWRLHLSYPAGDGIMRFSGMMLDRKKAEYILFIEQSHSSPSMTWRTASLQSCAPLHDAKDIIVKCHVLNSIPQGYQADNFRFACVADGRMIADIVDNNGKVILSKFLFIRED